MELKFRKSIIFLLITNINDILVTRLNLNLQNNALRTSARDLYDLCIHMIRHGIYLSNSIFCWIKLQNGLNIILQNHLLKKIILI